MSLTSRSDGIVGNQGMKAPVVAATTLPVTLSGLQTIDGVVLVDMDRVLVKDQLSSIANGIYNAHTGAWLRAHDWDGKRDISQGTLIPIGGGTVNQLLVYQVTTSDPIVIGIDSVEIAQNTVLSTSAFMATLLDDTTATIALATLGLVVTTYAKTLLDDANAAAVRTTLGLGTAALLTLALPVTVAKGGTGETTAAAAQAALIQPGQIVQSNNTKITGVVTGTTVLPNDDTIPQNDEGDELMTVTITPTHADNRLEIKIVVPTISSSAASRWLAVALFQDDTAGALTASTNWQATATGSINVTITWEMAAGTTNEITFKIRVGANAAGTTTVNGFAGIQKLGGVMHSYVRVTEYKV